MKLKISELINIYEVLKNHNGSHPGGKLGYYISHNKRKLKSATAGYYDQLDVVTKKHTEKVIDEAFIVKALKDFKPTSKLTKEGYKKELESRHTNEVINWDKVKEEMTPIFEDEKEIEVDLWKFKLSWIEDAEQEKVQVINQESNENFEVKAFSLDSNAYDILFDIIENDIE